MDRLRLEYAAEGFLSSMRRVYAGRNVQSDVEIGRLNDYSPEDRGALIKAISNAIRMTEPETDLAFQQWLIEKSSKTAS